MVLKWRNARGTGNFPKNWLLRVAIGFVLPELETEIGKGRSQEPVSFIHCLAGGAMDLLLGLVVCLEGQLEELP